MSWINPRKRKNKHIYNPSPTPISLNSAVKTINPTSKTHSISLLDFPFPMILSRKVLKEG